MFENLLICILFTLIFLCFIHLLVKFADWEFSNMDKIINKYEKYHKYYEEGKEAFNKLKDKRCIYFEGEDNPYKEGSEEFTAWDDGFIDTSCAYIPPETNERTS